MSPNSLTRLFYGVCALFMVKFADMNTPAMQSFLLGESGLKFHELVKECMKAEIVDRCEKSPQNIKNWNAFEQNLQSQWDVGRDPARERTKIPSQSIKCRVTIELLIFHGWFNNFITRRDQLKQPQYSTMTLRNDTKLMTRQLRHCLLCLQLIRCLNSGNPSVQAGKLGKEGKSRSTSNVLREPLKPFLLKHQNLLPDRAGRAEVRTPRIYRGKREAPILSAPFFGDNISDDRSLVRLVVLPLLKQNSTLREDTVFYFQSIIDRLRNIIPTHYSQLGHKASDVVVSNGDYLNKYHSQPSLGKQTAEMATNTQKTLSNIGLKRGKSQFVNSLENGVSKSGYNLESLKDILKNIVMISPKTISTGRSDNSQPSNIVTSHLQPQTNLGMSRNFVSHKWTDNSLHHIPASTPGDTEIKIAPTDEASGVVKKTAGLGASGGNVVIASSEPVSSSSGMTCRHSIETTLVSIPGCVPKSMIITRCQGSCHSRSVPEFDSHQQDVQLVEHCTCCKPMVMKFRAIRFNCPRSPQRFFVKRLGFPFRCACRPCATVPHVTAQQPYDY